MGITENGIARPACPAGETGNRNTGELRFRLLRNNDSIVEIWIDVIYVHGCSSCRTFPALHVTGLLHGLVAMPLDGSACRFCCVLQNSGAWGLQSCIAYQYSCSYIRMRGHLAAPPWDRAGKAYSACNYRSREASPAEGAPRILRAGHARDGKALGEIAFGLIMEVISNK